MSFKQDEETLDQFFRQMTPNIGKKDLDEYVTVVHLPEIGLKGNTHFIMSDLNNVEVADFLSE